MYRQSERRINIVQKALFPLTASWPDLGLFAQSLVAYIVETFSAFPWHFRLLLHPLNGIAKHHGIASEMESKYKASLRTVCVSNKDQFCFPRPRSWSCKNDLAYITKQVSHRQQTLPLVCNYSLYIIRLRGFRLVASATAHGLQPHGCTTRLAGWLFHCHTDTPCIWLITCKYDVNHKTGGT